MVSNLGNVVSIPRTQIRGNVTRNRQGTTLRQHDNGRGYMFVVLCKDGSHHPRTVHRMVATAFIENPNNLPEVNHKDGVKSNNCVDNLEWVSKKENARHAIDVLDAFGFNRALTEEQVLAIRADSRPEHVIADEYGMSQSTINCIKTGKTYKNFGGKTARVGRTRQRKLTAEQIADIRTSNLTGVELAEEYGVSRGTICKIKKGQRYKEVST